MLETEDDGELTSMCTAPSCMRATTVAILLYMLAWCSGVSSSPSWLFTLAPALASSLTTSSFPFLAALCMGVVPRLV